MPTGARPDPPEKTIRIAVEGNIGGQPMANIFWVKTDVEATSNGSVADLLDDFAGALSGSGLIAQFGNTLHVTQLRGVAVTAPGSAFTHVRATSISGTVGGAQLPASACIVGSWLSTAYWRGGKPRTYMGGVPSAYIDTNHSLDDSQKAAVLSKFQAFHSAVNGITTPAFDSVELGFVRWQSHDEWLHPPQWFPFTGVTIHDRLATQRRRLGQWLA